METLFFSNLMSMTEWYHYLILFVWIIILFLGIKYYEKVETIFKPKTGFEKGNAWGSWMLLISFLLGTIMVTAWFFKPAQLSPDSESYWQIAEYTFYVVFVVLLLINAYISFSNYKPNSGVIRILILTPVMILYFYTGMFSGLLIQSIVLLIFVIYVFKNFKKILTIR